MSRDIKGTSLNELNDGLERAVDRVRNQLLDEIADAEEYAVEQAINVTNANIRRAQAEANARMDRISSGLTGKIETVQRQLGAKIDQQARQTAQQLQALDHRHTRALQDLSDALYDEIDAQNKRITQEVNRLDRNIGILSAGLRAVNDSVNDLAASTKRRFQQQQRQIAGIQSDIKSIFAQHAADQNAKILAAGAALALLESVRERTDVERFGPRHMLDSLALKEERLRNIANNPDTCTITDANNLVDEVLVLENEAIRRQNEWEPVHKAVLSSAIAVLNMLEISETIKVPSLYDDSEEGLKTNYWTHGAYDRTLGEINELKRQIEDAPVDMVLLKELQSRVNELQCRAESLIVEAAEQGVLSEQRVIITNDVLNAMINQGWELNGEPDYMGGDVESDWREGVFAILSKPGTGEELSILVLPEKNEMKNGNRIIFHRNDELLESAEAFQSRLEEIKREIEKSGYELGALKEPEHGDGKLEQLRKHESMRRKGAAQKLKQTLSGR